MPSVYSLPVIRHPAVLVLPGLLALWLAGKGAHSLLFNLVSWLYGRTLVSKRKEFRAKCAKMLEETKAQLHQVQVGEERQTHIASLSMPQLLEELKAGGVTPLEALVTYQHRALKAHAMTNCLVHPFNEAKEQAEALALSKHRGPLYGLPIGIKDTYPVQGYTSAMGLTNLLSLVSEEDAVIVKLLKKQGAVPFVKTNIPQVSFSYECSNPITGVTTHPLDQSRTPGGSSGGDAALVLAGGAPFSLGSDIGGSLRCPAAYCGLTTIKPTAHRLSHKGIHSNYESGQEVVWLSLGPLARDVDSLVLAMKALLVPAHFELDPEVPPMPFQEEVYMSQKPLKVGYYLYDGMFPAVPACRRAVMEAKAALERRGHQVVEWNPPDPAKCFPLYSKVCVADNLEGVAPMLFGEPQDPCIKAFMQLVAGQGYLASLRILLSKLWDRQYGKLRESFNAMDKVIDWWNHTAEVEAYRRKFNESFEAAGLDAVLSPPMAFPAPVRSKDCFLQSIFACNYLLLYNLLNIPAGVVPVSKVTKDDITAMADYSAPKASPWVTRKVQQDLEGAEELPLGVQCASLKWREELCLRVMKEVETGLQHDSS